jgi:hypothetical protein
MARVATSDRFSADRFSMQVEGGPIGIDSTPTG